MRSKEVEEGIKFLVNHCFDTDEDVMKRNTVLSYIYELEEDNLHWRGKYHLVTREINVIPKDKIRDKINNMFEIYHERYELDFKEVRELISEIHRKVLKELEGE